MRKLILCDQPPCDGAEITYSEFTVKSKADLDLLATGEAVNVLYEM